MTLDIRPRQWRELCREEAVGSKEGRNEWLTTKGGRGEWKTKEEKKGELQQEEMYMYSGGWQGGWDSRTRSSSSRSSIKRCVSMDIKLLDNFDFKESSGSF